MYKMNKEALQILKIRISGIQKILNNLGNDMDGTNIYCVSKGLSRDKEISKHLSSVVALEDNLSELMDYLDEYKHI